MPPVPDILASLGLEAVITGAPVSRDAAGRLADPGGVQVFAGGIALLRGLHHVIEGERAGAWRQTMHACGQPGGRRIGANLDATLAARRQPALAALPLEASLALLEQTFAASGWGRLHLDLAHAAEHGLVVARLEHSFLAEALAGAPHFADAFFAGVLQGFFEHVTGQSLGSEEIGCAAHGAPACTFVITAPERLAAILPRIGLERAEVLLGLLTRR